MQDVARCTERCAWLKKFEFVGLCNKPTAGDEKYVNYDDTHPKHAQLCINLLPEYRTQSSTF